MKKIVILLFLLCYFQQGIYAQNLINQDIGKTKIPQEQIFMHQNASFLLTGEKLLYTLYCVNSKNKQRSKLSKVAYVELIDRNLKVHFKHKIILKEGLGYGDFFIPTTLLSGNYKLIVYTTWMKNGLKNNFFHSDLSIFNPFIDNSSILKAKDTSNLVAEVLTPTKTQLAPSKFNLNKTVFSKREMVKLVLNSANDIPPGSYSISVNKVDDLEVVSKISAVNYQRLFDDGQKELQKNGNALIMPEFRGELIQGRVVDKALNRGVSKINVALSIPGKDYVFKVSTTDENGNFYFNIDQSYSSDQATLQIINNNPEGYILSLDSGEALDYKNLEFKDLSLTEETKDFIVNRSIDNQVERSYGLLKQDSIKFSEQSEQFYNPNSYQYLLDDYTRFPTLKETIVEVIEHLYYSRKGDQYSINILGVDFVYKQKKPILLVDGILVLNHNDMIDFKAERIKKINVLKENYIYGTEYFNGIIAIETFNGDYRNLKSEDHIKNIDLFKPLSPKIYFNQDYSKDKQARIPDFRHQLYWEPNLVVDGDNTSVVFYTSDVNGSYEIDLEGFTNTGDPVSRVQRFKVE